MPEPKCSFALVGQLEDHLVGQGPHTPPRKQSPILLYQVHQGQLEEKPEQSLILFCQ